MERRPDPRRFAARLAIRPRSQVALVEAEHREQRERLTFTRTLLEAMRPVAV